MTHDGGGWTLIAQSVPSVVTSLNQCTASAVSELDLDAVTVTEPAKLADATIEAIWAGGEKEIRMLGELGVGVVTPASGWGTDCQMDFDDTQVFTALRGATWTPEVDAVSCLTGDTALYAVYDEPDTCGYSFRMQGGDYFIWTYDHDYTLHCGGATAGRSWPGSSGNNGCNTSKTWVRADGQRPRAARRRASSR